MKTISVALDAHLSGEVTTIAMCWKVTRRPITAAEILANQGAVFGFTNHVADLTVGGVLYQASTGYTPSGITNNINLAVDNLDVIGLLDSTTITEQDLQAGLWDYADIEIFQVNYQDLSQGTLKLCKGNLGEIKLGRQQFTAELRGLAQKLQQTIGEVYSPSCRAQLGDVRCTVDLTPFTVTGTVTSVADAHQFADSSRTEADDYFKGGVIKFTSGDNEDINMEIKSYTSDQFTLQLPMPYVVQIGDTYTAIAGCQKRISDCIGKFSNVVNFRGEPYVPGNDKIMRVGGQ